MCVFFLREICVFFLVVVFVSLISGYVRFIYVYSYVLSHTIVVLFILFISILSLG